MDSLSLIVKILDVFVALAGGLGVGIILVALWFLLRLLPERIRKVVSAFVAPILFWALFRGNVYQAFAFAYVKFAVFYIVSASAIFAFIPSLACAVARSIRGQRGKKAASFVFGRFAKVATLPNCLQARYCASYLRRTTVLLQ